MALQALALLEADFSKNIVPFISIFFFALFRQNELFMAHRPMHVGILTVNSGWLPKFVYIVARRNEQPVVPASNTTTSSKLSGESCGRHDELLLLLLLLL